MKSFLKWFEVQRSTFEVQVKAEVQNARDSTLLRHERHETDTSVGPPASSMCIAKGARLVASGGGKLSRSLVDSVMGANGGFIRLKKGFAPDKSPYYGSTDASYSAADSRISRTPSGASWGLAWSAPQSLPHHAGPNRPPDNSAWLVQVPLPDRPAELEGRLA